jgi:probable rRNA maturation factor
MADPANGDRPVVVAVDEQDEMVVDVDRWARLAGDSLVTSGVTDGELNLLFVDETVMTELNKEHMDEDRPTDVLSFPLDGDDEDPFADGVGGERLIGDIVVCPTYSARQAPDHRGERGHDGSVEDELALLVVHGVLHILGHDHAEPDETTRMQAAEQDLLDAHHRSADRS